MKINDYVKVNDDVEFWTGAIGKVVEIGNNQYKIIVLNTNSVTDFLHIRVPGWFDDYELEKIYPFQLLWKFWIEHGHLP